MKTRPSSCSLLIASVLLTATLIGVAAEEAARDLIFEDNFEGRQALGPRYGEAMSHGEAFTLVDGVLIAKQTRDDHGSVLRLEMDFDDLDVEFDFRFSGGTRFNFVIDDKEEKSVHAGHICRVSISPRQLKVGDDKTGAMNLKVREQRKAESLTEEQQNALDELLARTESVAAIELEQGQWYQMRVRIVGDLMEAWIDGELVTSLRSPGIDHPTKTKFGMTVNGSTIDFDNLKVFAVKAQTATPIAAMPEAQFAFFSNYCLDCHDSLTEEGKVNLEDLSFTLDSLQTAEVWQKVLNTINSGEMPPEKKTQPSSEEKAEFLDHLSHQLVDARKILSDSGGVITMRRLNRREYENTIEDLLGIAIDAESLPNDLAPGTFDTVGSGLFFSSDQFEQYFAIAKQALESVLIDPLEAPPTREHQESESRADRYIDFNVGRYTDNKDRAEAWLAAPAGSKRGDEFTDIPDAEKWVERYNQRVPPYEFYKAQPETKTGVLLVGFHDGFLSDSIIIPENAPPGDYRIRARLGKVNGATPGRDYVEMGVVSEVGRSAEISVLEHRKISGTYDDPEIIDFTLSVTPTSSRKVVIRERTHNSRVAVKNIIRDVTDLGETAYPASLWIDWMEWEGPINDPERTSFIEEVFAGIDQLALTDDSAREIIQGFATRAFRIVEPDGALVEKLLGLYRDRRAGGDDFKQALIEPLAAILATPQFLYLSEPSPGQEKRDLTNLELAVRLSYFLWSSPPDEELYSVARAGALTEPEALRQEVDRMLSDPRAMRFVSGFTEQWLHMDRLDFFQFNSQLYPEMDESGKNSAREEVFATLKTLLDENLSIEHLLKSKFVVIDDLLADYYGIKGVEGSHFRKVEVAPDSPRGGLLGTAAVLAMGSDGERSSPVERGSWIMRYLLHDPPPPAPANVPQLSRLSGTPKPARELVKIHQEEAQCAQCHRKIDPLGFGLENFDASGKWRALEQIAFAEQDGEDLFAPINPAGTMPDKSAFADYFEMRDLIAKEEEAFSRGFTEALIAYSLGRPYGFTDYDLVEEILRLAKDNGYESRTFIHALIQSETFRQK